MLESEASSLAWNTYIRVRASDFVVIKRSSRDIHVTKQRCLATPIRLLGI